LAGKLGENSLADSDYAYTCHRQRSDSKLLRPNQRPQLGFLGANFVINSRSFLFNWNNLGKRPALGGMATLFALSDSESEGEKLGEASISQSGGTTTITPTFGYGTAQFNDADIQKSPRSSFLVCATYFDDTGKKYGQNFRFRLGSEEKLNQRPVFYDPSASKKSELCGPDFPGRQELLICNLVHHLGL